MDPLIIVSALFAILLAAFIWFYLYSRTPAWGQSETRKALLSTMVLIGPLFGMHHRREPPEPPTISAPGPDPGDRLDVIIATERSHDGREAR